MALLLDDYYEQNVYYDGFSASVYPLTFACWYYQTAKNYPATLVTYTDASASDIQELQISNANNYVTIYTMVSGDYVSAVTTAEGTYPGWNHACGVFASATSRSVYLNGGSKGTNTTSRTPTGLDRICIGGRNNSAAMERWLDGYICEVGVWQEALTDDDVVSLYKGYSPLVVKPRNLLFYSPYYRNGGGNYIDRVSGLTGTEYNGPLSVASHVPNIKGPAVSHVGYTPRGGIYSRGEYVSLPNGTTDLTTKYSAQDYIDVKIADNTRVTSSGQDLNYVLHQFKNFVGTEEGCTLNWEGQSSTAPKNSTVYLQIYKVNGSTWETVASNSVEEADTDFQLYAEIASLTDYVSGGYITCRVYQRDI